MSVSSCIMTVKSGSYAKEFYDVFVKYYVMEIKYPWTQI